MRLVAAGEAAYIPSMQFLRRHTNDQPPAPQRESAAARARRLAHERSLIAVARAQINAGEGIAGDDLETFLDALDGDEEPKIPVRRRTP